MLQLDQYQIQLNNATARKYQEGIRALVVQLATGGGKTVCFASLVDRFLKGMQRKVVIMVHREELLIQASKTLFQWYDITAAPVVSGTKYLPNVMVYVVMVETAYNRLKVNPNYFGNVGMVIYDEGHRGEYKKMHQFFKDAFRIAFTATPISGDKKDPLKNHFQDIICGIDIPDLIELNRKNPERGLVPNKTIDFKNVNRKDIKVKGDEFDITSVSQVYSQSKHVLNTVKAYQEHANHTKAIIFNSTIEHSIKVRDAFRAMGYPCEHLDGETPKDERKRILKWLADTPNALLCNVGVVGVGFDDKSIQTVIVNTSTKSLVNWLQWCGRGGRALWGKIGFLIIDMGGNAEALGDWSLPRDWKQIFFNPELAKEGKGEAPSKACIKCRVIIHASVQVCPHCGASNRKKILYDAPLISLETLMMKRPLNIDVENVVMQKSGALKKDGTPMKDISVLHAIKGMIVIHVRRVWKIKRIDDRLAKRITDYFIECTIKWCEIKEKKPASWLLESARKWMIDELERSFEYKPQNQKQTA
ncbi:MAG: DEAD/DEAH box helicase family protein [Flavihumibacter sp.]|nr:DEAD/DEAH box helicase family protein [Flavihumibacter sp.]